MRQWLIASVQQSVTFSFFSLLTTESGSFFPSAALVTTTTSKSNCAFGSISFCCGWVSFLFFCLMGRGHGCGSFDVMGLLDGKLRLKHRVYPRIGDKATGNAINGVSYDRCKRLGLWQWQHSGFCCSEMMIVPLRRALSLMFKTATAVRLHALSQVWMYIRT